MIDTDQIIDMEYNSDRPRLIIPEYGRNVQKMVEHLATFEDREERNRQAHNLIDIIGNLNPQVRDVEDFKHKLWDHLFVMSDFKLDVDSPYPKPTPESFLEKPELIQYPENSRTYRHYGNIIKSMIKHAVGLEDGEHKEALVNAIANQMKKTYLLWNKDSVEDGVILKELDRLAEGKLKLDGVSLQEKHELVPKSQHHNKRKNNNRGKRKNYKKK
jgi:hypothetical protein